MPIRIKPGAKPPERYPEVVRHIGTINDPMWTEVGGKRLRKGIDYITQKGLQEYMICREDVNILLLGSQPGSGKTAGLLLAALDGIHKQGHGALFVKKQLIATKGGAGTILEDAKLFYRFADCEFTSSDNPTFTFPTWGSSITFTHANFPESDKGRHDMQEKFKNFQCARIFIDEATDHSYHTFVYLQSRNRDTSGVLPRMILTFNVNSHHWTRRLCDWWLMLDPETGRRIPDPAKIGKVRYAVIRGESPEDIIWGDTKQEVIDKADIRVPKELRAIGMKAEDMVKTIAFRPANMAENMEMMTATKGRHAANVFNLGGVETEKLFWEDWDAETEGSLTISNQMVRNIFTNPESPPDAPRYATCDISGGGDNCLMFVWRGDTLVEIEVYNGDYKNLPEWIKANLRRYGIPMQNCAFDAKGVGAYLQDFLSGEPIIPNARPYQEYDEDGNAKTIDEWYNLRSQLMGHTEAMIQLGTLSCTISPKRMFPHGPKKQPTPLEEIFLKETEVFRTTERNNRTYYNSKDEFKHRNRYSPDYTDCLIYHQVFVIKRKERKMKKTFSRTSYLRGMLRKRY